MRVYAYYSPEDIQRVFIAAIGVPPETVEISDAGAVVRIEGLPQPLDLDGSRSYTRRESKAHRAEVAQTTPRRSHGQEKGQDGETPTTYEERCQEPLKTLRSRAAKFKR